MTRLASFTEDGPWELDFDEIPWRKGLDEVRVKAQDRVPGLVRSRRLPPLRPLGRASTRLGSAVIGWALHERRLGRRLSRQGISRRLRVAFARLGPTYIKLGQVLSAGEGILPDELVTEFHHLRDRVAPESFDTVVQIVEGELGQSLNEIFSRFDREPVAAASIAQVHFARLRSGEEVAVKVQRPAIDRMVEEDLAVMAWLAPLLGRWLEAAKVINPPAIVELFAATIVEELDFRLEAQNMLDMAVVVAKSASRSIVVPRPHPVLVTRRVLVMERLGGLSFADASAIRASGIDASVAVQACMISFLEGVMIHGVFHGDLHGGNLLLCSDGRVVLLDHGITGRLDESRRRGFLKLLMTSMVADQVGQMAAFVEIGALPPETDIGQLLRDVPLDRPAIDPTRMDAEQMLTEMRRTTKALVAHGMRLPKELLLFVKNVVFLDSAMVALAPQADLIAVLTGIAEHFTTHYGDRIVAEVGMDPAGVSVNRPAVLAGLGADEEAESFTYQDLRDQREEARLKMSASRRRSRKRT